MALTFLMPFQLANCCTDTWYRLAIAPNVSPPRTVYVEVDEVVLFDGAGAGVDGFGAVGAGAVFAVPLILMT